MKIQVSGTRESEKSIGALINLKFDEFGNCTSASDLFWFPKSICKEIVEEYKQDWYGKIIISKRWFILAPKWFLDKNNIPYETEKV
jgi:hypothetical protein